MMKPMKVCQSGSNVECQLDLFVVCRWLSPPADPDWVMLRCRVQQYK